MNAGNVLTQEVLVAVALLTKFADEALDLVLLPHVLQQGADDLMILFAARRALRAGGTRS